MISNTWTDLAAQRTLRHANNFCRLIELAEEAFVDDRPMSDVADLLRQAFGNDKDIASRFGNGIAARIDWLAVVDWFITRPSVM